MPASDDAPGPAGSTPSRRIEIGPPPTGDHTRLWIRLGLLTIVALTVVRVLLRLRRAR